jgi:hypothetical protein
MASLTDLPELIGFFSYSRDDDDDSHGTLSELRDRIQRELRGQLGRSRSNFRLWQDKEAIAPGKLWESEIKAAIEQAVFFIPIVTPTAVKSQFCKHEFDGFLARERALGRDDLVFPIYYIRVPALENDAEWRADPVLSVIGQRQWTDWRDLRLLDVQETRVREAVAQFCARIVETLQGHAASPEQLRAKAEVEEAKARAHADEEHAVREHHAAQAEALVAAEQTGGERDDAHARAEPAWRQDDAPASRQADKDEPRPSETTREPAAVDSTSATLLAAIWPETEQNRDHRYLTFAAVAVLAFAAAVTVVDAVVLLFGSSSFILLFHPTIVALYVVLIAAALWPKKPRSRLLRYALVTTIAVAAFWMMYVSQGSTYWFRAGYMLLATSILYVGIIATGNLRVAVPLVLLSALAFVAMGFMRPTTFSTILSMNTRLLMAAEILTQGLVFAGVVAVGWGSPTSRTIAAVFLINLAETLLVGIAYSRDSGLPLLVASVVSAFGVAALTQRAWQRFAKLPMA